MIGQLRLLRPINFHFHCNWRWWWWIWFDKRGQYITFLQLTSILWSPTIIISVEEQRRIFLSSSLSPVRVAAVRPSTCKFFEVPTVPPTIFFDIDIMQPLAEGFGAILRKIFFGGCYRNEMARIERIRESPIRRSLSHSCPSSTLSPTSAPLSCILFIAPTRHWPSRNTVPWKPYLQPPPL